MLSITGGKDAIAAAKLDEAFMDVFGLPYQEVLFKPDRVRRRRFEGSAPV